jgi:hypothetical protein
MSDQTKRLSRRNFLLTVGAGGAATAAAVVATQSKPVTGKSEDKRSSKGYQASEHISNYYRTTKV